MLLWKLHQYGTVTGQTRNGRIRMYWLTCDGGEYLSVISTHHPWVTDDEQNPNYTYF